jgi:pyridoxamine 5'-phosphate oxidase
VSTPDRELRERDVDADPFVTFAGWYDDAVARGEPAPDAMTVATATPDGRPSARMVLLRGVDGRGFCFYTNLESRKAGELAVNPVAAIVLHWPRAGRQVRAEGTVEPVTEEEADRYWYSRPRPSRLSAWASNQSRPIDSRVALEAEVARIAARFGDGDVTRPPFWGGYRLVPDEIELWQHRDDRLHDRLRYRRVAETDDWVLERLQP